MKHKQFVFQEKISTGTVLHNFTNKIEITCKGYLWSRKLLCVHWSTRILQWSNYCKVQTWPSSIGVYALYSLPNPVVALAEEPEYSSKKCSCVDIHKNKEVLFDIAHTRRDAVLILLEKFDLNTSLDQKLTWNSHFQNNYDLVLVTQNDPLRHHLKKVTIVDCVWSRGGGPVDVSTPRGDSLGTNWC